MGCIIVTMPKTENANTIKTMINRSDIWEEVVICTSGSSVMETISARDVDLVICTPKLSDMGFSELAEYLPHNVNMLLLTQNVALNIYSGNIMKLLMPLKPDDLVNSIKLLIPRKDYTRHQRKTRSESEQKAIDSAKQLLMDRNGLTEPEAFRYLQKVSMDSGRSMVETAQMVMLLRA